jgi:hypothetical protein
MKKQILNEVNRAREIMGLKPLLLEQATLLTLFRKLLKNSSAIEAFGGVLKKKFGKIPATGIPITTIGRSRELVPIMLEMMQNTKTIVRSNGQLLKKKLALNGVEITESQAHTLSTAWKQGDDVFTDALETLGRVGGDFDSIASILSKGRLSDLQKPLAEAIESALTKAKISNIDDLGRLLKELELPDAEIQAILKNINEFGTIGSGDKLERIFGALISHPNYQDDVIKILKNSSEFQDLVRIKGDGKFTQSNLAKAMGLDADDPVVKLIYSKVIKETGGEFLWRYTKGGLQKLFLTPAGRAFLIGATVTIGINYFLDWIYGSKGKAKAGLTPDMYIDVSGNKSFLKKYGGYTDAEALKKAEIIQEALYGNVIPGTVDDKAITKVYDDAPSILAASQICYMWEVMVPNTSGTLENTLKDRMSIKILPTPLTKLAGDTQIGHIKDELESKRWTTSKTAETRLKYLVELRRNWPRYRSTLTEGNTKWYSRLKGPIDNALLAKLMEDERCEGQTMEDCLRKFPPRAFNATSRELEEFKTDIYSKTQPDTVQDTEEGFFNGFLSDLDAEEDKVKWLTDILKETL